MDGQMAVADHRLLEATVGGDADAFAQLYRRHERAVTRFVIRRSASADEVADVVSDTFLVALRRAGSYTPVHDSALPWLLGIARHQLLGQHRARTRARHLVNRVAGRTPRFDDDESAAIAEAIDAARVGSDLQAGLLALSAGERAAFELVALDGLSAAEAATVLDISAGAVRTRLTRARSRLRLHLPIDRSSEVSHG